MEGSRWRNWEGNLAGEVIRWVAPYLPYLSLQYLSMESRTEQLSATRRIRMSFGKNHQVPTLKKYTR
jgi:hypothetical protein